MSGQTSSLCCPQCAKKIEPNFIQKNLDSNIYEKFLEFSIRSFEGSKKDEKNATCPSKGKGKRRGMRKKETILKINIKKHISEK